VSSLILFSKNDLLFGAMRPYFHKVTIAPFDGITRSTCFVFKPKVPETRGFSLCLLNLDSTIRYSTDSSLGSTMPYAIWKNGLARHKIVLPPSQIMVAFSETISPLIDKIRDVGLSVRSLSSVRDVMLPRLISGELSVS
jgi:type I restriction enzyme S subunit